ncbi:MAG: dienelactone hydrolase family protein, partial [Lentisphaerae bacterium]|nr:dienelactone hydrolase family protein [Lentisphaerota bacterium]
MTHAGPDHNRPGLLGDVEPVEQAEHAGHPLDAAFLVFEDRYGRTCRVYAERCCPGGGPAPALVHCPGGGQTVNRADLADWADKGFACVSFDWQIGRFPDHDPARKSRWPDGVVGQNQCIGDETEAVLPVAIEAAGVCLDWLHASDRVRRDAAGVAGISWGGYLAWLVAAYEPRIAAAVPVYGCGGQCDARHPAAFRLHPAMARLWRERWDPCTVAPRRCKPVCYLSATDDFFGIAPLADGLLNRLQVPHRREWLPNANHCISPGGSALGLAWLRHYLAGGPALPEEPALGDGFAVAADRPADVAGTETWWTPALRDGDLGCW